MKQKTLWMALALSALALQLTAAAPAQLIHTPVLAGSAGQDLQITATLVGAPSNAKVRVYFRPRGKEIFRSLELEGAAGSLSASIPGDAVEADGLEYYLEAAVFGGAGKTVLATYPPMNPALSPVQVAVHQDSTPPDALVLNPTDGSTVDSSDPVLSVALNDDDSGIDPASVGVILDGKPLPSPTNGEINPYTLQLHDLKDGAHSVVLRAKDKAGNLTRLAWSFTVAATSASKAPGIKAWVVDGRVGYETAYGLPMPSPKLSTDYLPYQPYGLNRGDLDVHLRSDTDTLGLKVHLTDEERGDEQPLDRYTGTWSNREGVLTLGDVSNITFTELTVYQLPELRGFEADLRSGALDGNHSRFIGLWGQTQRPIEGGTTNFSGVSSTATYGQYLYGARWESGGPHFQVGWNAVTINDDQSSLSNPGQRQPNYNTMISSDWMLAAPEIHLALTAEGAVDYYANGTDPNDLSAGGSYRANALWNMLPWGTKASFEWRDLGGTLSNLASLANKAEPSIPNGVPIPGGYSSMGNPGLISDYRGFESEFAQRLYDGQLNVDINYNNWRDNLNGTKDATTVTNFISAIVGIAPLHWPNFSLGFSQSHAIGTPYDVEGLYSDIVNNNYNAGVGYTAVKQNDGLQDFTTWTFNLNYNLTQLNDLDTIRSAQDLLAWNLVGIAIYTHQSNTVNVTAGLGQSSSPAATLESLTITAGTPFLIPLPNLATNTTNLGAHWVHQWAGTPYDSNLGWDLSSNDSSGDATGAIKATKIDSLRNTYSGLAGYKLGPNQRISLQLAYAMVNASTMDSATNNVTVNDNYGELYTDLQYNMNF
jgi:hypothetical protein